MKLNFIEAAVCKYTSASFLDQSKNESVTLLFLHTVPMLVPM